MKFPMEMTQGWLKWVYLVLFSVVACCRIFLPEGTDIVLTGFGIFILNFIYTTFWCMRLPLITHSCTGHLLPNFREHALRLMRCVLFLPLLTLLLLAPHWEVIAAVGSVTLLIFLIFLLSSYKPTVWIAVPGLFIGIGTYTVAKSGDFGFSFQQLVQAIAWTLPLTIILAIKMTPWLLKVQISERLWAQLKQINSISFKNGNAFAVNKNAASQTNYQKWIANINLKPVKKLLTRSDLSVNQLVSIACTDMYSIGRGTYLMISAMLLLLWLLGFLLPEKAMNSFVPGVLGGSLASLFMIAGSTSYAALYDRKALLARLTMTPLLSNSIELRQAILKHIVIYHSKVALFLSFIGVAGVLLVTRVSSEILLYGILMVFICAFINVGIMLIGWHKHIKMNLAIMMLMMLNMTLVVSSSLSGLIEDQQLIELYRLPAMAIALTLAIILMSVGVALWRNKNPVWGHYTTAAG